MNRIKNTIVYKAIAILLVVSMLLTGVVIPSAKAEASDDSTTSANIAPEATISAENHAWGPWVSINKLTDGKPDSAYGRWSSKGTDDCNTPKTITLTYTQAADVQKITLHPYIYKGVTYGFPESFSVSVWNGKKWVDLGTSSGHTDVSGPVEFAINEVCNSIRITANILGKTDGTATGTYAFHLSELEVYGQYTEQTLLSDTSPLANYWNNIAPYATSVSAETWGSGTDRQTRINNLTDQTLHTSSNYSSSSKADSTIQKEITLTFDTDYAIEGVVLYPSVQSSGFAHNGFPKAFTVSVSNDGGSTWNQVATGEAEANENGYVADPVKVSFDATCGTQVKITATQCGTYGGDASQYGLQLGEVVVLGTPNIAPYATASATSKAPISWGADLTPDKLNDNTTGTFYASAEPYNNNQYQSMSMTFDFSNNYDINGVVLYPRAIDANNGFPQAYTIEVYNGDIWKEVARETTEPNENGSVTEPVKVLFDTTCGSKLRITATKLGTRDGDAKYGIYLAEVNIFGSVANELYHNVESSAYEADDNVEFLYGDSVSTTGEYQATVTTDRLNNQRVYLWKPGDTHLDNEINVLDLAALMKSASGVDLPTKSGTKACDLNQNHSVDEDDMDMLRNKLLGVTIPTTSGTVYYVDSSAAEGGDGLTPGTALNLLPRVSELELQPGDAVLFKRGSEWSNNRVIITDSGTAERPILFSCYGDENASLPVIHVNSVQEQAIYGYDISHVIIENIEVTNKAPADTKKNLKGICIEALQKPVDDITIRNCYVHDVQGRKEWIEGKRDPHHNGGIVVLAGDPAFKEYYRRDVQLQDITIEGNRVKDCSLLGIVAGSVNETYYTRSQDISIKNNEVYGSQGDGILLMTADKSVIEYNTVGFNGYNGDNANYAGAWCLGSSNVTMQYNEVYGQRGTYGDAQGFDIDVWCENITIQYNYSHDNAGGFLLVMDGNEVAAPHTVRYNVSKNDGNGGKYQSLFSLHMNESDATKHPFVEICNNTFYFDDIKYVITFPSINQDAGLGDLKYYSFKNNIFYGINEYALTTSQGYSNISEDKITVESNCFVGLNLDGHTLDASNTMDLDPQFVLYDAGADAFRLRSDSPCLGKGAR